MSHKGLVRIDHGYVASVGGSVTSWYSPQVARQVNKALNEKAVWEDKAERQRRKRTDPPPYGQGRDA